MQTAGGAAEKTRVLVIDDSRVMRHAVNRVLNQEFDILEAEDGEAGWEKLVGDQSVQVVISDVQMPRPHSSPAWNVSISGFDPFPF